jgi:branched-chain amino acid transport system permease protein
MTTYLVLGVVLGASYGLLTVGLIFVYRTTRLLNFSFGACGMVGAFVFDTLQSAMSPWAAFALTTVLAVLAGSLLGLATLPVQDVDPTAKAVASLALMAALQGLVVLVWGNGARPTPTLTTSVAFHIAGVAVTWQRLLALLVVAVATSALIVFFRRGRIGSALRAVAEDRDVARLIGLPIRALWMIAWALSTGLAVLVCVVILPDVGLDPDGLTYIVLVPLAAVVVGRFRSVAVGFTTAFGLGLAQSLLAGSAATAQYQQALPLAVIVGALLLVRRAPSYERV